VAERGTFIHKALDGFVKAYPSELPADACAALLRLGREAFGASLDRPAVWAFWWPRFERIAAWVVTLETERRLLLSESLTERLGRMALPGPAGAFTLKAKADRIDRARDGGLTVIDYKTGTVPKKWEVDLGLAPQLPLEAMIAEAGGFGGLAAASVTSLEFWRLSGGDPAGEVMQAGGASPAELAAAAEAGLRRLIAAFDDPATAYLARPHEHGPRYSAYGHLARIAEWGGEDGE
jgi:ATP-dependent helicase/nuclease subunit B